MIYNIIIESKIIKLNDNLEINYKNLNIQASFIKILPFFAPNYLKMRQREYRGKNKPNTKSTRNKPSGSGYSEKENFRPKRKSAGTVKSKSIEIAGKDDIIRLNRFIASTGLRIILALGKKMKASGSELVVCSMNKTTKSVFEMSGFTKLFKIFDTE